MLNKLLLQEYGIPVEWLETIRSTDRTKRFLEWKENAKLARKQGRKRKAQERDAKKSLLKKQKANEVQDEPSEKVEDSVVPKKVAKVVETTNAMRKKKVVKQVAAAASSVEENIVTQES